MQSITHDYKLLHPLMNYIEQLYYLMSGEDNTHALVETSLPSQFKSILQLFADYGYPRDYKFFDMVVESLDIKNHNDRVVVCVSGGKDSLATVLHYVEEGYDVRLFHLKGINKCYPDEHRAIERASDYLKLPLCEWEVKLHGNHQYTEHPLKNWIFMNAALTYAVTEVGTTNVAVGNFFSSTLEENKFDVSSGDAMEMWDEYCGIINDIIPNFNVLVPLENVGDTLKAFEGKLDLLEISQSCLGTYRFKEYRGNNVRKKFGFPLMPHRCGGCWKCALEYIYFCDRDMLEFNKGYYQYCLLRLFLSYNMVFPGDLPTTIQELWDSLLINHDITESKLYPEIETYEIDTWKKKIWFEPKKYNV